MPNRSGCKTTKPKATEQSEQASGVETKVESKIETKPACATAKADITIQLPNLDYALSIQKPYWELQNVDHGQTAIIADQSGKVLQLFKVGDGHIVALAENIFAHHGLKEKDHAELLLALTRLTPQAKNVAIIQRLKATAWYHLLWDAFTIAICTLALGLALLFWRAVRRFGPLLPEPELERRSLIEHIDAAAGWAWTSALGRDLLLEAVRSSTRHLIARRVPELSRLSMHDRIQKMALSMQVSQEELAQAWLDGASHSAPIFTRQIQLLQQLRTHYER